MVTDIVEGGLFDTLGVEVDDKILSVVIGEKEYIIDRTFEMDEAILDARVGDTISIKYKRGSDTLQTNEYTLVVGDFITFE